jgi:cytochrome c553
MIKTLAITIISTFSITSISLAADANRGKELYNTCIQCHGEAGLGNVEQEAPKIAGQHDWYILNQLNAFKAKTRKNPKMYPYIKDLSVKDFEDLAAFVSKLK